MTSKQKAARKELFTRMSESGLTLAAIGDKFGLTRERVRQIIGSSKRIPVQKAPKWPTRYWHQTMRGWMAKEGIGFCWTCKLWKQRAATKTRRCPECNRKVVKAWQKANPELHKTQHKRWLKTPKGKQVLREYSRRKYEKLRSTPEGVEKLKERWRKTNARRREETVAKRSEK